MSITARNDDLVLPATADTLGRRCGDTTEVLENVDLYTEYCAELRCLEGPRDFPSGHARFWFFRKPDHAAHDDTRLTVTVMSGLPGAGKDHRIGENRPDLPVVSLDALRAELGIPAAGQRPVAVAATERAREHLRTGRYFVWNATHVSRDLRDRSVGLAADYGARVEIMALEAPPRVLRERMARRSSPVPTAAMRRLVHKWGTPDPTEAHRVAHDATA